MQTGRCSAPIIDWERLGEGDFIGDKGMQKTESYKNMGKLMECVPRGCGRNRANEYLQRNSPG